MWCPYGIGRESWDREVLRIVCSPFPARGGDLPSWCASLRGCRRVGPHRVIVVEYIIILIIIIVVLLDFAELLFCQTVNLESLLFSESAFLHSKMMARHPVGLLFFHFSYALEGRICFLSSKMQLPEG